jgi:hypothetical protein
MNTYLSIDCDYFAHEAIPGEKSAQRLKDILTALDKPLFITHGHEHHAFDVNRYNINRLINVDYHADCYESTIDAMEPILKEQSSLSGEALFEYCTGQIRLAEWNWINYCMLCGKRPVIEHWRPARQKLEPLKIRKTVPLIHGKAKFVQKHVSSEMLLDTLMPMKDEIAAIGIAVSAQWCDRIAGGKRDDGAWALDFCEAMLPIFQDRSLYSFLWATGEVFYDERCLDMLPELILLRKRMKLAKKTWLFPNGYRTYGLLHKNPDWRCCANVTYEAALPHLPSIRQAAEVFAQWS